MKDIKGYEGLYAVTSCGKVWSYRSKKFLKPDKTRIGYIRYRLSKNNKTIAYLAHRLVAEAYIENPNNLSEVSHLDETRDNNCINNLKWVSHIENCNMPLRRERLSNSLFNFYKEVEDEQVLAR